MPAAAGRSAFTSAGMGLAPGLELQPDLLKIGLILGELCLAGVEVHRDEVEPFALFGIRSGLERGLSGRRNWSGRQSLVPVGVVLRLALAGRSEERRVGKECGGRWTEDQSCKRVRDHVGAVEEECNDN